MIRAILSAITTIPARLWGYLAVVVAIVGVIFGIRRDAVKDDRAKRDMKAAQDDLQSEIKANDARTEERRAGGDNAAIVERLHERDAKWPKRGL